MMYVIDSSTAFKWVVAEVHSDKAIRLRNDYRSGVHELLAPDLFPIEISNSLVVAERRGRIQKGEATLFLHDVLTTAPVFHPGWPDLLPRAHQIAETTVASVYDSLYIALAEREGCEFVTADDRLVKNLRPAFSFIIPLASLP